MCKNEESFITNADGTFKLDIFAIYNDIPSVEITDTEEQDIVMTYVEQIFNREDQEEATKLIIALVALLDKR